MKTAILLALTALISTSAFADSQVVSFGRNNVEFATLWGDNLSLRLKEDADNETKYQLSCEENVLTLIVDSEEGLTVAQTKVENCRETLKEVYLTSFETNMSVTFSMSQKANSKGIYQLNMNYSTN